MFYWVRCKDEVQVEQEGVLLLCMCASRNVCPKEGT